MEFDEDLHPPPTLPPAPPNRTSSNNPKVTFKGAQTWRESIGMFLVISLAIAVLISTVILLVYVWRDKQVYEELVDYLDKTISTSKINDNPVFGFFKLTDKELEILGNHKTYKTLIRCYLLSDLGVFAFIILATFIYFTFDISSGTKKVVYWVVLACGVVYAVIQVHIFTFALVPYSNLLPNATEKVLDHAIPHNPGALQQMEYRLGCVFDHNLYKAYERRHNPKNTCDPQIESSIIPVFVLIFLLAIRLLPIIIGVLLFVKRTPLSESLAQLIEKMKGNERKRLYIKKQQRTTTTFEGEHVSKSTTFGVNSSPPRITSTPLPPVPSPGQMDHSISYNNAAYFATSGAFSSRSSEISRIDANELFKNPMNRHASGSIQSEV